MRTFSLFISVPVPPHPVALGSGALSELVDIQEAFKRKDINERDVEMLYMSWMQRYKSGKASASMKERQVNSNFLGYLPNCVHEQTILFYSIFSCLSKQYRP